MKYSWNGGNTVQECLQHHMRIIQLASPVTYVQGRSVTPRCSELDLFLSIFLIDVVTRMIDKYANHCITGLGRRFELFAPHFKSPMLHWLSTEPAISLTWHVCWLNLV